jgi:N-acyl homoserine lactone hydrolase
MLRERDEVTEWIEASGMKFELVDGSTELANDLHIMTSPGHTSGHQSVVATTELGIELFIGDAAYTRRIYESSGMGKLPDGQASDIDVWRGTLSDLKALEPQRVHFCHDG